MIELALNHPEPIARRRYITIFYHAKVLTFPLTFIDNLEYQTEDNKEWGLRQSLLLLKEEASSYSQETRQSLFASVRAQIMNGDHRPAIVSDLWTIAHSIADSLPGAVAGHAASQLLSLAGDRIHGRSNHIASQKRLIDLALSAKSNSFPQTFLTYLHRHEEEVKKYGLSAIQTHIQTGAKVNKFRVGNAAAEALRKHKTGETHDRLVAIIQAVK